MQGQNTDGKKVSQKKLEKKFWTYVIIIKSITYIIIFVLLAIAAAKMMKLFG